MTEDEIFNEYGVNWTSKLSDLLDKLKEVEKVSDKEKRNIESISVKTLPSVVYNQEDNIKKRMYGIATDSKKGMSALLEKRIVLLRLIINKLLMSGSLTNYSKFTNEDGSIVLETTNLLYEDTNPIGNDISRLILKDGFVSTFYQSSRVDEEGNASKAIEATYTFTDKISYKKFNYLTNETIEYDIATSEDLKKYVNQELLTSTLPIKDLKISGKVEGNLIPIESGKYNLGNTGTNPYFWKDLFLTGKICFNDKTAIRDDGNSLEIGEDYHQVKIKKTEISNDGISVYSQEQTEPIFKATKKEVKVGENNGYLDKFMAYANGIELTSNEEMSLRNKTIKMNLGQTINDFDFLVEKADGTDVLKLDRLKQILLAYDKEVLFKENFDKYKQEHANEYEILNKKVADFLDVDEETMNQLSELINAINNNETGLGSLLLEINKKIDKTSIANDFESNDNTKVLSASKGKDLYNLIQKILNNFKPIDGDNIATVKVNLTEINVAPDGVKIEVDGYNFTLSNSGGILLKANNPSDHDYDFISLEAGENSFVKIAGEDSYDRDIEKGTIQVKAPNQILIGTKYTGDSPLSSEICKDITINSNYLNLQSKEIYRDGFVSNIGSTIIVDELPTSDIIENALYKIPDYKYIAKMYYSGSYIENFICVSTLPKIPKEGTFYVLINENDNITIYSASDNNYTEITSQATISLVSELPTTPTSGTIYIVKTPNNNSGLYHYDKGFKKLVNESELSSYYTKSEIDELITGALESDY